MKARYKDLRTNLDVHPVSGDLLSFDDEAAISSQIKNLCFIAYYEVFGNMELGAGIPQTLFDNASLGLEDALEQRIRETINNNVDRAELLSVKIRMDDRNGYSATIVFKPLNSLTPVTINTIIKRVR